MPFLYFAERTRLRHKNIRTPLPFNPCVTIASQYVFSSTIARHVRDEHSLCRSSESADAACFPRKILREVLK